MPIVIVALTIVVVGVVLWLVKKYVPMDANVSNLLTAFVVIVLVVWVLQILGVWQLLFSVTI